MGLADFIINHQPGISVDDALIALSKGSVLIDVRSKEEYQAGHAPGARPVNLDELSANPLEAIFGNDPLAERDAPIVLICDNGLRSGVLARQLRQKGLLVESIKGGLMSWIKAGNPVIPGAYRGR